MQKENGQDKERVNTASVLDKKHQYLLEELSELIEKVGGDYGPFLMEELQQRMEHVVHNFDEELKALIKSSFKNWKIKDSQLRDLMSSNMNNVIISNSQTVIEKSADSSTPNFIKGKKFGPKRNN